MNSRIAHLLPYPFERLRSLLEGCNPPKVDPVPLYIGEPKHASPKVVRDAITANLDGLSGYPPASGSPELRTAIARWLERRFSLASVDENSQVLPVTGTREALFSLAQAVIDPDTVDPVVVSPNPFYQIYEGAAVLAGAKLTFVNQTEENNYRFDLDSVGTDLLRKTELVYVCSPANPSGDVLSMSDWKKLFELSDEHGFVIAADECYSEIYFDEPPLGALQAAHQLGRSSFKNLIAFGSLSKRSNLPGMRSGYVAGDAEILSKFLQYRTYHGCAMSPTFMKASIAAWNDEDHVIENRAKYAKKFSQIHPLLSGLLPCRMPTGGFYLWAKTPGCDEAFTRALFDATNITVLPGTYLARDWNGVNPGAGRIRIALVAEYDTCIDAAQRIADFARNYTP